MLGELRRELVLQALAEKGSVTVAQLSECLRCSQATLRRDLQQLEGLGLLRRTHGGAVPQLTDSGQPEQTPRVKAGLHIPEKVAIGSVAAGLVADGDVIAFNGGTTTLEVARAIRQKGGSFRVVTNSLAVANELVDQPNVEVMVLGGRLRISLEMSGPQPEQLLEGIFINTAFIGVDGLTVKHGITTYNQSEARTNSAIIAHAERVVVVADHTKIGRLTMALISPISSVHVLITDAAVPESGLQALRDAGIEILVAP